MTATTRTSPRISFRLNPATRDTLKQVTAHNGVTLSEMVREFLYRYVATAPEPTTRSLPSARGSEPTTVYVGARLAYAAHRMAQNNGEDLSRPVVEFLTRVADEWSSQP